MTQTPELNSDMPDALPDGSSWEWLDRKTNPEIMTAISGIGPCGRPMNEWALPPYQVGLAYVTPGISTVCMSDIRDCSRCPMNPNRVGN